MYIHTYIHIHIHICILFSFKGEASSAAAGFAQEFPAAAAAASVQLGTQGALQRQSGAAHRGAAHRRRLCGQGGRGGGVQILYRDVRLYAGI